MTTPESVPGVIWVIEGRRKRTRQPWRKFDATVYPTEAEAANHLTTWRECYREGEPSREFRVAKYVRSEK